MQLRGIETELRSLGADLTVIGSGAAHYVEAFQEETGLAARILSDPDLKTYQAAGLRRGVAKTFSLSSLIGGLRAYASGHRQTGLQGDPWQQGGALVVAPDGPVLLHHVSESLGDHVAGEILLAVVGEPGGR